VTALPLLAPGDPFPPVSQALAEPDGLLAAGGDLSCDTLLRAYARGIFPWFSDGDPILWWSPDPRLVLDPADFHCQRSLAKRLRRGEFRFSLDHAFPAVLDACASTPRHGETGTWIVPAMSSAYNAMHLAGHAHSVEVWQRDELVGGLYGICLGSTFFGESMFSHASDASKAALALLCALSPALGIDQVDCQVETAHLQRLGASNMPRQAFIARLGDARPRPAHWDRLSIRAFDDFVEAFTLG
jgi:leucyl/phenylalanyl-tRNA--protein transferase